MKEEVKSWVEQQPKEDQPRKRVGPGIEREETRPREEEVRPAGPTSAARADQREGRSDPRAGLRPVWAEIDLDAIAHNVRALKSLIPDNTLFLAVVKANAYGHGAVPVAREALAAGADRLGVALPDEGVRLRQAGIEVPIHLLGMPSPEQAELVAEYDLIPAVSDLEVARALSCAAAERGHKLRVHVKVDTGMGRLGLRPPDVVPFLHALRDLGGLKVEGVFTHLATADEADKSYARQQYEAFLWTKEQIRAAGLDVPFYHCANSAALLDLPEMAEGMVRPGIALYGYYPSAQVQRRVELKPAMQLKARVAAVKRLPAGSSISYGRTYTLARESEVALLPLGYADGFSRLLSNRAQVLIGGRRVPQVGRVCMDQCMIEVPAGMEVRPGQEAVLFGQQGEGIISVEEVAERLGTISYEVVCLVSARVPRVYLREGQAVEVWEADWRLRAARLEEGE